MKTKQIYSTACNNNQIVHGTVEYEGVPFKQVTITNRAGDQVLIDCDSLDALIVALQSVQKSVMLGV